MPSFPHRSPGNFPPAGIWMPAFSLLVALLASGCMKTYQVKVDGIKDQRLDYAHGTPYILLTPPEGALGEKFDAAKAEAMIKTAMATQGYYPVTAMKDAELVVTVEYGSTAGRVNFKQRSVMRSPVLSGGYDPYYGSYPGIIPVSTESQIVSEVVKTKYITFSARDPRKMDSHGKPIEVWNLVIKVEDQGENLEEYIPVLLAAGMNYLGSNTGEQLEVSITSESEAVQYVTSDATFEKVTEP